MSSPKTIQMCVYAVVQRYNPKEVTLDIRQHYEYEGNRVGDTKVDDYGNITKILATFEVTHDMAPYLSVTADEVAVQGLKQHIEKLRADFQKSVTETQARIQEYLAIEGN